MDGDNNNNGKGGKQGKSINDSISEHKCTLTSNIIYTITTYHTKTLTARGLEELFSSCAVVSVFGSGRK